MVALGDASPVGAKSSPHTLRIATQTLVLTAPAGAPLARDRLVFYEAASGDDRGRDYADCVVTNAQGDALCHVEFVLKHGAISIDGVINVNATTTDGSGPILGGTGRYNGARGTVSFSGPATKTRFTFHVV
jgi:hypothetical protein